MHSAITQCALGAAWCIRECHSAYSAARAVALSVSAGCTNALVVSSAAKSSGKMGGGRVALHASSISSIGGVASASAPAACLERSKIMAVGLIVVARRISKQPHPYAPPR